MIFSESVRSFVTVISHWYWCSYFLFFFSYWHASWGQEKRIEGKWVNNLPDSDKIFLRVEIFWRFFSFSFVLRSIREIRLRNLREILRHWNDFKKTFSNYFEYYVRSYFLKLVRTNVFGKICEKPIFLSHLYIFYRNMNIIKVNKIGLNLLSFEMNIRNEHDIKIY